MRAPTLQSAFRPSELKRLAAACLAALCFAFTNSATAQSGASTAKELTVERIYSAPSLVGSLHQGVQWTPDGKRISYLQAAATNPSQNELWVISAMDGAKTLLLDAAKLSALLQPEKPAAIQSTGLGRADAEDYFWSPHSNALLFKSGGRLVWLDLRSMASKLLVNSGEDVSDPKFSPDGKWVSYLRNANIWLANIATGEVKQLTTKGNADLLEGQLDWVYPEELDLATAYWWSPDSQKIAFLEFDERPVRKYPIVDLNGKVETTRYPQAGEANPVVRVGVESIAGGDPGWIDTGADTDVYLPRVDWVPDGKSLLVQRLNRAQTKLDVLLADAATGKSRVIITEQDPYWLNLSDLPIRFFADAKRFLWASERSGFCHIYIYNTEGRMLDQLTSGNWEVSGGEGFGPSVGNIFSLDEGHGYVYFESNKDNPVERQLYRVSLSTKKETPVTTQPGTHDVFISPEGSDFLDTYSNAMTQPQERLLRADGTQVGTLDENPVPDLAEYHLSPMEFLHVPAADGTELNASIIKPANFDASRKYPVLVYVYGGPHVQEVVNAWGGDTFLWCELMAQKGYVIFTLDNRGSYGRGHAFETPLYHHFGKIELADQIAGVNYLKTLAYVDPVRIGIFGASYGGYMTLEALFNTPEVFKAGAAIAPVSDWRLYDTIYTERYMGRPQDNAEGYDESSPVNATAALRGKLLLAHATGDDNVHFANATEILDKLILQGTYATDLVILPGRGHSMSDRPARIALYKEMEKFFSDNL